MLVLNTFGVYPPNSGGKKRIFYLFEALARHADVTLLNLGAAGSAAGNARVRRALPRDPDPARTQRFRPPTPRCGATLQRSVTDIAALLHAHEIPMLESAMTALVANADVVVASHVYLAPFIARHWKGELWYDAHNVEADMKADILGVDRVAAPFADSAPAQPDSVERSRRGRPRRQRGGALVRAATRVLAASEQEARRLADLYGRDIATIEYAPNGVSLPDDPWLDAARRARLKATLGFEGRPLALFVGSDHGPNHEAAGVLVDAARTRPDWSFVVAGSICDYQSLRRIPSNVYPVGLVSQAELTALFRAADVGLNPMLHGSGTNLKMLDYAAHGALVLSTEIGARGLGFVAGHALPLVFAGSPRTDARSAGAGAAVAAAAPCAPRRAMLVEERFSWRGIADRIAAIAPAT